MEGRTYQRLFEQLKADIFSGRYRHGQKMPSEAAPMKRTGMSRITVSRAVRELQMAGLAERIVGSGTFAREELGVDGKAYLFGLLIPELGQTEVFAPLCRAIAGTPAARPHALLWGKPGSGSSAKQALHLAQQFLERQVDVCSSHRWNLVRMRRRSIDASFGSSARILPLRFCAPPRIASLQQGQCGYYGNQPSACFLCSDST